MLVAGPIVILLLAAGLAALLAGGAWRRRRVPGALSFGVLMAAVALWSGGYALEWAAPTLLSKVIWTRIEYVGIVAVPLAWLIFALHFTGRDAWLSARRLVPLGAVPLTTLLLVWSNEWHGLVWRRIDLAAIRPFHGLTILEYGPWFWVHVAYAYLALLTGTGLLLWMVARSRHIRRQAPVLVVGILAPASANLLYLARIGPFPGLDLTPLAFGITGLAFSWCMFRVRLLDIFLGLIPIARDAVFDDMDDAVLVLDHEQRVVDLNRAAAALLPGPAAQFLGQPIAAALPGWAAAVATPGDGGEVCAELSRDGEPRAYDLRVSALHRRRGQAPGQVVVLRDVTESRQAARARQLLDEASTLLTTRLDDPTVLQDLAALIGARLGDICLIDLADATGRLERTIAGGAIPDTAGRPWAARRAATANTTPPTDRPCLLPDPAAYHAGVAGADRLTSALVVPLIARGRHLGHLHCLTTARRRPLTEPDLALATELGRRLAIAIDNVRLYRETETALQALRESQAQLVQAGKLAAVGTLAAGVAHELNQPLMVIRGQAQIALTDPAITPALRRRLTHIEHQTAKMSVIIDHLRAFGRTNPAAAATPVDLNRVVREALVFTGAHLREQGITLTLDLAAPPPLALADANQIEQIVLNLLVNARDALEGPGAVAMRTWREPDGCHLSVADSGAGIPPEVLPRLFEPFYTTKPEGRGTGLGLSISRGIAHRWGGDLTLTNQPAGAGALAHLRLPAANDAAAPATG